LLNWKNDSNRNPLLLRGALQVGKSTAVKQLARHFDSFVEVNFEQSPSVKTPFEGDLEAERLIENLSVFYNIQIVPGKTL